MVRRFPPDVASTHRSGVRRPRSMRLSQLYAHEYPVLMNALARLIDDVRLHLPTLTLLALFGSVARLNPKENSDTDILALFDVGKASNTRQREDELAKELFHAITATVYADEQIWPRWGITTVTGDALGHSLDLDLLSVIGREGIMLYYRAGAPLPPLLEHLTPFGEWREHVQAVIAAHV